MKARVLGFSVVFFAATLFSSNAVNAFMVSIGPCTWSIDWGPEQGPDNFGNTWYEMIATCKRGPCRGGRVGPLLLVPPSMVENPNFPGDFDPSLVASIYDDLLAMSEEPGEKGNNSPIQPANNSNVPGQWRLFPNPGNGVVHLTAGENAMGDNYQVSNMLGQVISKNAISDPNNSIDISAMPSGVYMLNVYSGSQRVQTVRFIKQ